MWTLEMWMTDKVILFFLCSLWLQIFVQLAVFPCVFLCMYVTPQRQLICCIYLGTVRCQKDIHVLREDWWKCIYVTFKLQENILYSTTLFWNCFDLNNWRSFQAVKQPQLIFIDLSMVREGGTGYSESHKHKKSSNTLKLSLLIQHWLPFLYYYRRIT